MYSGCQSLVECAICKYFLPFCRLSYFLWCAESAKKKKILELYNKNYKILMKEIIEDIKNGKISLVYVSEKSLLLK
jgi:hypothetical protein